MNDDSSGARAGKWSVPQMVNCIAFGTEPGQSPATVVADTGPFLSPEIMDALEARAAGNPRSWPKRGAYLNYPLWPTEKWCSRKVQPNFSAAHFHANVETWMRQTGSPAPKLLAHARAEQSRYEAELRAHDEQQAALAAALDKLNAAAASSKLKLRGRPSKTPHFPCSPPLRQAIPSEYFDEPRGVSFDGKFGIHYNRTCWDWLHAPGPFFYNCEGYAAEVIRVFGLSPVR